MVEQKSHNDILSDLIWVIRSPVLFDQQVTDVGWWDDAFCQASWERCAPIIDALRAGDASIEDFDIPVPTSYRLGHYFEYLVTLWMEIDPRFSIVARNQVIQNSERTLGELDFILEDKHQKQRVHLEVAVKFYIGLPEEYVPPLPKERSYSGMGQWFGPGLKDRLDKKFAAMQWRQLPLGKKTSWDIDVSVGLVKGRLFSNTLPPPNGLSEKVEQGGVLLHREAAAMEGLVTVNKRDWFSLMTLTTTERGIEHAPVQGHVGGEYVFVVPDDWYTWAMQQRLVERDEYQSIYESAVYTLVDTPVDLNQAWSKDLEEYVLITAYNPMHHGSNAQDNQQRHTYLSKWLSDQGFTIVTAMGQSTDGAHQEPSLAVKVTSAEAFSGVMNAANLFGQRAVLWLKPGQFPQLLWC